MQRGLYIAATGMLAEQIRQDQIANDLANASTPGYKADRSMQRSFSSLLLENTKTGQQVGPLSLGAGIAATRTDFSQGALRQTGQPLDIALSGDGFLAVATADGVRYTRNGQRGDEAALGGALAGAPALVGEEAQDDVGRVGALDAQPQRLARAHAGGQLRREQRPGERDQAAPRGARGRHHPGDHLGALAQAQLAAGRGGGADGTDGDG